MAEAQCRDLVNGFTAAAGTHFTALENAHGLQRSLAVEAPGPDGLAAVQSDEVHDCHIFLSLTFPGAAVEVEISYGLLEPWLEGLYLNCVITLAELGESYSLREWLNALDEASLPDDCGGRAMTVERVEQVVARYECVLELVLPLVLDASPATLGRLRGNRERFGEEERDVVAEREHRHLVTVAAEAFRRCDYVAVVDALSAVQVPLAPAEKAKLAYALRRIE